MAPEQEDGLAEQRGAEHGDHFDAAGAGDEPDEPGSGLTMLLGSRTTEVRGARRVLGIGPIAAELDGNRCPALEQR